MKKLAGGRTRPSAKPLFVALGVLALAVGTIGVVLPVLPTTPLYMLAALCFAKGSERFHRRFMNTRLCKKYLGRFLRSKSMTLRAKLALCAPVTLMLAAAFCLAPIWHAKAVIAAACLFKWWYFMFRIKTVKAAAAAEGNAA